jgi:hypothetical protein
MTVTFAVHSEKGSGVPEEIVQQRDAWLDIWLQYLNAMPEQKVDVMVKAMEWDLQAQRSSRRKTLRRPGEQAGSGE